MNTSPPLPAPATTARARTGDRPVVLRLMLFLALFASLQGLYGAARGGWVERLFIDHATVQSAAWLIHVADPAVHVRAVGSRVVAPGGGINVLNGCEGADVVFLMIAAMFVAPLPLRARITGILAGVAVVFVLNQARVIALFYASRGDKAAFEWLHGVAGPLVLVTVSAAFFALWLGRHVAGANRTTTT
ncbi:MAG: archaeosortase/exosortase family protein [Rhodocyclaceae bacterium]|jgi:exosortase/archaeosortase family protein|nr:archaeosortase/exosortase family protein [Rhodocyclaceae bacterium]MCA3133286.1 archaeosortase/exosortase family protein [Rhodocyclaceae bacterium]MCA3142197.1 archaeosortase/exosortase family protein [Rhodocyclaceae bacterium]MCA3146514.1 archaeosortase/exosortase family protein [Rhodocyclaceae bacterium]